MQSGIPWIPLAFVLIGLVALAWSSGLFVDGSASLARALGISPLIVGMVIIGFGTSAPELCVSVLSGLGGHSNLSLGNAYGSDIFNIAGILGVSVLIYPLLVRPRVSVVAGVGLAAITVFAMLVVRDGACTRSEACALLGAFLVLMPLYCWYDQANRRPAAPQEARDAARRSARALAVDAARIVVGFALLVLSSRLLVDGAVDVARWLGVSDLVIGLTVVAVGTSLPELASAVQSARRHEHELVLGNIIGSNLFNTLAVVGVATAISPLEPGTGSQAFSPYILSRDLPFVLAFSISILVFGLNWRHPSRPVRIGRVKGAIWLVAFAVYTVLMVLQETGKL